LKRDCELVECPRREYFLEELPQRTIRVQVGSVADEVDGPREHRSTKDSLGVDAEPLLTETLNNFNVGIGGNRRSIHRSDGGAHDEVGPDAMLEKRLEHPNF
jgi:hypothetical protein